METVIHVDILYISIFRKTFTDALLTDKICLHFRKRIGMHEPIYNKK